MLKLKTIRGPGEFWPGRARRAHTEGLQQEAREMSRQAVKLRELVRMEITPEDGDLEQSLRALSSLLDGDSEPEYEDQFGIAHPHRWEPWYAAHLFRCAVSLLERDRTSLNPGVHCDLAVNLADLSARVMSLQTAKGSWKVLTAAMMGELPW